jgi:DNA-binding response OmpR family regulator
MILIIEDNHYTQHLLRKQLKWHGFESVGKNDASSGLAWLQEHPADLVMLDIMLPDADGMEICRQIRGDYPTLPIILFSALANDPEVRARGVTAGASDFVAKPYSVDELIPILRTLLTPKS